MRWISRLCACDHLNRVNLIQRWMLSSFCRVHTTLWKFAIAGYAISRMKFRVCSLMKCNVSDYSNRNIETIILDHTRPYLPCKDILGHIEPYWNILGHTGKSSAILEHIWSYLVKLVHTIPYWVTLGHTEPYWNIPGYIGKFSAILEPYLTKLLEWSYWVILGYTGPYLAKLDHNGPY